MKKLILIILLLPAICTAKTMYKCANGNRVDYQFKPCGGAAKQEVIEDQPRSVESQKSGGELEEGVTLGDFSVRDESVDSSGYVWYAYKVMVSNHTNKEREVSFTYKAVDSSGFEIKTEILRGTIPANSYEDLTGRSFMKSGEFNRVNKWVLEK
jgi:hypothetical protein